MEQGQKNNFEFLILNFELKDEGTRCKDQGKDNFELRAKDKFLKIKKTFWQ